jgi:hypothetical protein
MNWGAGDPTAACAKTDAGRNAAAIATIPVSEESIFIRVDRLFVSEIRNQDHEASAITFKEGRQMTLAFSLLFGRRKLALGCEQT